MDNLVSDSKSDGIQLIVERLFLLFQKRLMLSHQPLFIKTVCLTNQVCFLVRGSSCSLLDELA